MLGKDLLKMLEETCPNWLETEIGIGNADIISVSCMPSYYDGCFQKVQLKPNKKISIKYSGEKISLESYSLSDAITDTEDFELNLLDLSDMRKEKEIKHIEKMLKKNLDYGFVNAKIKIIS